MSVFKCKMCGGTIEFEQGATVGVCDSCGTKQTLPRLDDDRKANLYDRANHFRRNNDFDKAMSIYEQVLNEDNTDAEAYWSLVLCRYGIEYVEDPASRKRIPTVNRAQFTSIFADEDYKSALQYADGYQKTIYEDEAKAIDEIQKGILAISQKEEPFDVFICYKETDANGRRTQDSVLANDLYHQLTEEGFKVFFSRITLEDKLGTAYEPYIFAALNSAKAMVVLGTKPEYFNAVWVKNEWSRYLALIKNGAKKTLIPAYRDMDPYDLPEEFSHLQAQDMSKLGFMQDLIRGIKKIISSDAPKATAKETVVVSSGNTNLSALLDRAFMFLEDGDWQSAGEYSEKVLDSDPRNATAYLGKLMAELHVRKREALADCADPFDNTNNYQKTMRFADESLRKELAGYIEHINARNEHDRLEGIYNNAETQKASAKTESDFKKAADVYSSIIGYRDAAEQEQICLEKAEDARKDAIYSDATSRASKRDISEIEKAIELYRSISEWKDSSDRIYSCQERIEKIKVEDEQKRIQDEKDKKARTKKAVIGGSIAAACVAFMIVLFTVIIPTIKYNKADSYLKSGDYQSAMASFAEIDSFKDAHDKYTEAFVAVRSAYKDTADQLLNNGDRINAAVNYIKAGEPVLAKYAYDFSTKIATTWAASAGVTSSNHLMYAASREALQGASFSDVSSISNFDEYDGIIGLDSAGKVVMQEQYYDFCDSAMREKVNSWKDIDQLEYGYFQTFALLNNGTVVSAYDNPKDEYYYPVDSSVSTWKNIVEIGTNRYDLWGIDSNGQFYYAPVTKNETGSRFDLSGFSSIKKVQFGRGWLLGLTTDGKLVTSHDKNYKYSYSLPSEINNISQKVSDIVISEGWIYILQEDGTIVAGYMEATSSTSKYDYSSYISFVQKEVSAWKSIVYVQSVMYGVMGEDIYGNVYYLSTDYDSQKSDGITKYSITLHSDIESALEGWKDIVYISSNCWTYGDDESRNILGVHADGTVSSLGTGRYLTLEENSSGKYYAKTHYDGTYDKVDSWKLW